MLVVKPISMSKANEYVEQNHRHHGKKHGCKFCLSVFDGDSLVGVSICGNPVARNMDDGKTLEVSRLCTNGTKNACSVLYGASARVAKEMGYEKIITYILETESGTSLKASGWVCDGDGFGAINWQQCNCKRQNERDERPTQESLFGESKKMPPEVLKKRYSKILNKII